MGRHIGAEAAERLKIYGESELAHDLESYVNELHRVIATSDKKDPRYQMLAEQHQAMGMVDEHGNSCAFARAIPYGPTWPCSAITKDFRGRIHEWASSLKKPSCGRLCRSR